MVKPVAVLIATRNRPDLLVTRAAASVFRQTRPPDTLVIVNDGIALAPATASELAATADRFDVGLRVIPNTRSQGAGGAWNMGLAYLHASGHRGFVALLDDDDAWDPDHLEVNCGIAADALAVVSGLRMMLDGRVVPRPLITRFEARDFLVGNPGWQGSNTFVDISLLLSVGGFRERLPSLNDRDLAYRLLRRAPDLVRATGRWTATWYADTPGNLSAPRSNAKRDGLAAFWMLYGNTMRPEEQQAFFQRALTLFDVEETEIRRRAISPPPLGFSKEIHHDQFSF